MHDIFLISPVAKAGENPEQMERITAYVAKLEAQGKKVHWPIRDTKQDGDLVGDRICHDNMLGMLKAKEIHVWYYEPQLGDDDPAQRGFKRSTGSLFDFGITFLLHTLYNKKIVLANPESVKQTPGKSFENVLLKITGNYQENQGT